MNIPDKLKIGGQIYKIEIVPIVSDDDHNVDGKCFYAKNIIQIASHCENDYKDYVFLHELIHGILDHANLENTENVADRLAKQIHMVIKDNPDIFKDGD